MTDKTVELSCDTGHDTVLKVTSPGADEHVLGRKESELDQLRKPQIEAAPWVKNYGRFTPADIAGFANVASVGSVANMFKAKRVSVDLLVNCLGSTFPEPQLASGGLEQSLAARHIRPFRPLHLMLPQLDKGAPAGALNAHTTQFSSATARNGAIHAEVSLDNDRTSMRA